MRGSYSREGLGGGLPLAMNQASDGEMVVAYHKHKLLRWRWL
jgi:hypothetical protein